MRVTSWSIEQRHMFSAALRSGEPIELVLSDLERRGKRARRNLRVDEVAPLADVISIADPVLRASAEAYLAPPAVVNRDDRVTAVIPSNRKMLLGLQALHKQDVCVDVLVLSNGDGPHELDDARVVRVPWKGHGSTRAEAINHVQSDYVFFTVDDAIPLGRGCIRTLIDALELGGWDAVIARQIPWPHADAITASRLRQWTPPGEQVVPTMQTDHVATLMRTSTLLAHPIPDVPIAEDAWWSRERNIGYVPMAPVLHSHERSPRSLFDRNRAIHAQLVAMGHPATIPNFGALVRALPAVVRPTLAGGSGEFLNQLAELSGQWWGSVKGN